MGNSFRNPANGHVEEVDPYAPLWVVLFGPIYLLVKGLWAHAFIWFAIVIGVSISGLYPLLVLALPGLWIGYALGIRGILESQYLRKGWVSGTQDEATAVRQDLRRSASGILLDDPANPKAKTKICPYCAEEVLEAAKLCKHCRSDLSPAPSK